MSTSPQGIAILNVLHASRVAAIPTAAGPQRLLEAGLAAGMGASGLPVRVVDVPVPRVEIPGEIARSFAVADSVAREVRDALARGDLAVVLSGSCHTAIGSLSGIAEDSRGVVWLDCHGDFNTPETTESGLLDGTTLASITGRCWRRMSSGVAGFSPVPDEDVLLVGARSLDAGEAALLEGSRVTVISRHDAATRAPAALRALGERTKGVYVHIDLDVLDPSVGMANAFATGGGFSSGDLQALLKEVVESCPVRVVALASYDPSVDETGGACDAALELARALGAKIRRD